MKRISKLTINNFKAFKDPETILFDSKNILVHGANGSGKSSLYWTLYTFLQSSVKPNLDEVYKYFRLNDPQSLRNIHADDTADSFIELELEDTESNVKQTYKISDTLVNTQVSGDSNIKDANQASDFINYRLLLNFYNSAHSEEIELFWVFYRDILPYFSNINGENFGVLYTAISENTLEKRKEEEKRTRNLTKLSPKTVSVLRKNYNTEIDNFNNTLRTFVTELVQPTNSFLNTHFLNGDASLRISLELTQDASYDNESGKLNPPSIKMSVEQKLENGTYKTISRPHSFLNEARLTQIALSVRLAAMQHRVQTSNLFKFLVLDDMLISLDMSNRMTVVKIIITDPAFADFQLIILTHDKSFFNLIKRKTISQDWKYFDFVRDNNNPTGGPQIKDSKTDLEKAKEYFENRDLDGCANFLRKEAEKLLTNFLDPNMNEVDKGFEKLSNKINRAANLVGEDGYKKFKKQFIKSIPANVIAELNNDFESNPALSANEKGQLRGLKNGLLKFTIEQNQQNITSNNILDNLKELTDRILNPLSHGNDMPLYEQELKDAIEVVEELKVFLDSQAQP